MTDGMNMADMFGKIAEMQRKMAETQDHLGSKTVSAEAGGGMVKVTANGLQRVTSIKIEKEVIDPADAELLEDLVMAGVNKALEEAAALARDEMAKAAGGFIPPGTDLSRFGL
ncbi:MAG: YbaB/EbfC family nucleoid-associated protein [Bacteroidetes bacterium]|nr:YbaB/EbfC family nucleoid-associated protein [Bacteroidota bacterium]MDA0873620.1 YbaB/EbfC family nucleoid-associated protein [Bacteroidota bacterium]